MTIINWNLSERNRNHCVWYSDVDIKKCEFNLLRVKQISIERNFLSRQNLTTPCKQLGKNIPEFLVMLQNVMLVIYMY